MKATTPNNEPLPTPGQPVVILDPHSRFYKWDGVVRHVHIFEIESGLTPTIAVSPVLDTGVVPWYNWYALHQIET